MLTETHAKFEVESLSLASFSAIGLKILKFGSLLDNKRKKSWSLNYDRPNRPRFVLPISSHTTMSMGSFGIMLLFAFMAQFCMA